MKVQQLLDQIEQKLQHGVTRRIPVDPLRLLDLLNQELTTLTSQVELPSLVKRLHPVIYTQTGKWDYPLPGDFPENFVRGYNVVGDEGKFVCKLDTGTDESILEYRTPGQFFSEHEEDDANSRPVHYTIFSTATGEKVLFLGNPPDSNSDANYTIGGVYRPNEWRLVDEDYLDPTAPLAVLQYAVLRQVDPTNIFWGREYERHLNQAYLQAASNKYSRFVPVTWDSVGTDYY